jgi:hypothetical protein
MRSFVVIFRKSLHVALRRLERMKIAARGQGELAVGLDFFDAVFRENRANFQSALPFSAGVVRVVFDDAIKVMKSVVRSPKRSASRNGSLR